MTSAASTAVSQKCKGEARREGVPKILALLAHLFLLLATTLGNGARFRVQIKVNAWVVSIITSVLDSKGWVVEKYFKN